MERKTKIPEEDRTSESVRAAFPRNVFKKLLDSIRIRREHNYLMQDLRGMNDRQLSDIGLSRADVERIGTNSLIRDSTLRDRW